MLVQIMALYLQPRMITPVSKIENKALSITKMWDPPKKNSGCDTHTDIRNKYIMNVRSM